MFLLPKILKPNVPPKRHLFRVDTLHSVPSLERDKYLFLHFVAMPVGRALARFAAHQAETDSFAIHRAGQKLFFPFTCSEYKCL
jgi:hypothetical protein